MNQNDQAIVEFTQAFSVSLITGLFLMALGVLCCWGYQAWAS